VNSSWPLGPDRADTVREQLFEHRTILIRGVLDDAAATQAGAELMMLDALGDSRITVHLDATSQSLDAAFSVMDVIDLLGVPVHVLCVGRAEGPAIGILAVAHRRACTPHARFRLSDAEAAMQAPAADLARWAEQHLDQLGQFHQRLATAVHRSSGEVAADCRAGRYLTAEEALRYRLVDEIATTQGSVASLPRRPFGFQP
jgi:ATP-dependent Clp protease protease subunit